MASSDAATEIEGKLTAEWAAVEPDIEWYLWEDTDPVIGKDITKLFMLLEYPGGQSQQASIGAPGDNWWKEIAVFNLHIYYPADETAAAARAALKNAAAIFRGVTENSIIYRAPFPPQPGLEGKLSGNWMSLSMSVPYEYRIRA